MSLADINTYAVFAETARYQDERNIETALLQQVQCLEAVDALAEILG